MPTAKELADAHEEFLEIDPRDLFYRAASELVRAVREGQSEINLAEAVAVLLLTWNGPYYRFRPHLHSEEHFADIEALLQQYRHNLSDFETRSISTLQQADKEDIQRIFRAFRTILGPTGTAKALHLLAPDFFPLWEQSIADAYGRLLHVPSAQRTSAEGYWAFMQATKAQYDCVKDKLVSDIRVLKWLDEYNFCKYKRNRP